MSLPHTQPNGRGNSHPATAPPRAGVTAQQARQIRRHHQQLQHFINRMLNLLEVLDKAARAVSGIHGMLNGREQFSFAQQNKIGT